MMWLNYFKYAFLTKVDATFNAKIQLSLVGCSLGGIDSLTRLVSAVENNVLCGFKWSKVGELTEIIDILISMKKLKCLNSL